jgi:PKD repeat protein
MANVTSRLTLGLIGAALVAAGCTVHKQETPSLTGPSELGTAISIAVTPDVLAQDGASQSLVTVTARDANGQPLRSVPLRAEITVNGVVTDFGSLSARNIVTDSSGRATLTYTAPAPPAVSVDNGTVVQIQVVPSGSDFGNATPRFASIRLVPPGVNGAPNDLIATFTATPPSPNEDARVLFDATGSIAANPNVTIVGYEWKFGDGDTASGRQVTHQFEAGSYTVRLTIRDTTGRSGTSSTVVTVTPTAEPAPSFVFSPNPARLNEAIHFDASTSQAAPGHSIVNYTWNFGDGVIQSSGGNPRIDHVYTTQRTYVVQLTVTDDTGKTKTSSGTAITPQ